MERGTAGDSDRQSDGFVLEDFNVELGAQIVDSAQGDPGGSAWRESGRSEGELLDAESQAAVAKDDGL